MAGRHFPEDGEKVGMPTELEVVGRLWISGGNNGVRQEAR